MRYTQEDLDGAREDLRDDIISLEQAIEEMAENANWLKKRLDRVREQKSKVEEIKKGLTT